MFLLRELICTLFILIETLNCISEQSTLLSWLNPRGGAESTQIELLSQAMNSVVIRDDPDRWIWPLDVTSCFSVASMRRYIKDQLCVHRGSPTWWLRLVPIKVNVFALRLALNKLPTKPNMSLRGMELSSISCPICNSYVESTEHLFFSCHVVRDITRKNLLGGGYRLHSSHLIKSGYCGWAHWR